MKIMNMFSSPVFKDFLDLDNDALEKFCRNKCINSKKHQDRGFSQSDDLDLTDPELLELVNCIQSQMNMLHFNLGLSKNCRSEIFQGWANLDNNWSIRVPHSHPEATFACVYYVTGNPDSGNLEFINPNLAQSRTILPEYVGTFNEFTGNTFKIRPIPGKLIIFPAWLYHYVNSGTGNTDRISIAFNIKIIAE